MAGHELHHQKLTFAMSEVVHDSGQRGMTQVRQQLSFALERAPLLVVNSEGLFDRDDTTQILVHGLVDSTHAPVAELVDDAVALAQNCVGGKHVAWLHRWLEE